jgi:hypothetical protein
MTNGSDKYIETVRTLGKLHDFVNKEFFNSELDKPVIAISPDARNKATGWFTLQKVWKDNELDEGEYEINISANFLNRPPVDISIMILSHGQFCSTNPACGRSLSAATVCHSESSKPG